VFSTDNGAWHVSCEVTLVMKTIRLSVVVWVGAMALGSVSACSHENHANTPVAAVNDATHTGSVHSALSRIVSARCDREERCNNVGTGKDYDTRTACTSKIEGKTESDLNTKDCDKGIDQTKLDACISKIHEEECGNPIDSISRIAACRTGEVCI
jgi:hypothetical protein